MVTKVFLKKIDQKLSHWGEGREGRKYLYSIWPKNELSGHLMIVLLQMYFYDVTTSVELLQSIVSAMKPHFSSSPGSYYSDSLFFLSLGLHKIAPQWMSRCILVDIDTQFRSDPLHLWTHFDNFSSSHMIGLAPELSPVYRHTFFTYRSFKHALKKVGEPHAEGGYSGFNSGVILLHLDRLRESEQFGELCSVKNVKALTKKFSFHGHLGDQDFYTLLGIEHPDLIYILPCTWNRQLCTWWNYHGYADIFHRFFKCEGKVHVYHGNCNTQIPSL
ncbi:hypothetical protein B566_EDAN001729 [Ephemera danica]|nr:hypothetical protein B566_EDAN001729 [Ephemera danica]